MITIGSLSLGVKPCIAAVVDRIVPLEDLVGLKDQGIDLLELRVDLMEKPLDCVAAYAADCRSRVALPMIGTVRETEQTKKNRPEIFQSIMPFVDCIDIELAAPTAPKVQAIARAQGKTVIVSEHDFEKTPDLRALRLLAERAASQGADIVKIVTFAQVEEDAWRLLNFAKGCGRPIVAFAMGERGAFSRIRACEYGSLFTYGYITAPVAPGQVSALELVEKIKGAR